MGSSDIILAIGAFLFGAIVGSFINALSFRFNTGVKFFSPRGMGGRSRCMHCGHALSSIDLIPVISFLFLRGRCRYCDAKISWQYPLVELLAALVSLLVYLTHGGVFFLWFAVWMVLVFVVLYDLKHTVIPWSASGALAVLTFLSLFVSFDTLAISAPTLWQLLAGPILALPLFLLSLVSRGTWMGWGDSGLELSLGWMLGLSAGLTALCLSFWIGAVVGLSLIALARFSGRAGFFRYTIKSEMPFAPFLILGAALAFFFHVDFFSSLQTLF